MKHICLLLATALASSFWPLTGTTDDTSAAPPANLVTLVDVNDFSHDTGGWIETDWLRISLRQTGNWSLVGPDGVLRLYLGPYLKDRFSYHGHHANLAKRPLRLYGDFSITSEVEWDWQTKYSIKSARITLHGINRSAVMELRGSLRVWPGSTKAVGDIPALPLAGSATARFERRNGILRMYWNETLVAESEWLTPVKEFSLTARTFRDKQKAGAFFGIRRLLVLADPCGLPLSDEPVSAGETLFTGGDFQENIEEDIGIDLSAIENAKESDGIIQLMEVESEGHASIGAGLLKGWATPVDGKNYVWFERKPEQNERALLLDTSGQAGGVSFTSQPFQLEPGMDYMLTGLVKLSRNVRAELTLDPAEKAGAEQPIAQWSDTTINKLGRVRYKVRRIPENWFPINIPFRIDKKEDLAFVLSVKPVWSGSPFGTAAFDKIAVHEITLRDKLRLKMESLIDEAAAVREEAERAGYRSEVALDISGFDLNEAETPSDLKQKVKAERRAFEDWLARVGSPAAEAVSDTMLENGAVLTFFDRLPTSEIEKRATELQDSLTAWKSVEEEWLKRGQELTALSVELRPPRTPAPDYNDNSVWAANRFHIYWFNHYGLDPPGVEEAIRYMGAMGATFLQISPFKPSRRYNTWEEYSAYVQQHLDLCEREGMKLLIYGATGPITGAGDKHREQTRQSLQRYIEAFSGHPAFAGFEMDEIASKAWPDFREYLKNRFTEKELIELGIISQNISELEQLDAPLPDDEPLPEMEFDQAETEKTEVGDLVDATLAEDLLNDPDQGNPAIEGPLTALPSEEFRAKSPVLFMIGLEWRREAFEQSLAMGFEYAHSLKKDTLMMPLLSPVTFLGGPFNASLPGVSAIGDMIAIDPYWNGVPEEAFFCDLMRSNSKGPALLTVGTHYGGSPASLARDLAISYAHTDGVYIFDWPFCFKQKGPYAREYWAPGRWEKVTEFADKAAKIEPYLVHTRSPAEAAQIYSERSSSVNYYQTSRQGSNLQAGRYATAQMGLYNLFLQSHLSMDTIYMRPQTIENLSRYKALVIQDAMALTDDQESTLREWVRQGGHLIATASTSINDRWGRERENYGLNDVFGVSYVKTEKSDGTWFGTNPKVEYKAGKYFDEVSPTTGRVTATWEDGRPAVVENTFGKGRCIFISARDLGNCCDRKRRGNDGPRWYLWTHKDFHPGVREFLSSLVTRELEAQGSALPFVTENCPEYVETVMRIQDTDNGKRRVLHLLNYSFDEPVEGVKIKMPVAGGDPVVFYSEDNAAADIEQVKNPDGSKTIVIHVRNFNVHECIVVEK